MQLCSSRAITAPSPGVNESWQSTLEYRVRELNAVDDEIVVPPNRLN